MIDPRSMSVAGYLEVWKAELLDEGVGREDWVGGFVLGFERTTL